MKKLDKIISKINQYAEQFGNPYQIFGIFAIIAYPSFYLVWMYTGAQSYENIWMRMVVVVLCIPLALHNKWPERLIKFLPLYWYFTLWYCLPFLFTFLLLKNNISFFAVINSLTILTLCILLIDFIALIIIVPLGVFAGYMAFIMFDSRAVPMMDFNIIICFLTEIIFGALFARRKEIIKKVQLQLQSAKALSATMAHEFRTPLRIISNSGRGLKNYLPDLFKTYQIARAANLDVPQILPRQYKALQESLDNIEAETRGALTLIDMLMVTSNMASNVVAKDPEKLCSISERLDLALQRYPYEPGEKELVHWPAPDKPTEDFNFFAKELLVEHVIFNLLKNALYHIQKANKGEIYIWLESKNKYNELHFKDTGSGIPPKVLAHIFDQFFSNTLHGTGIGLTFCKTVMRNLGGDIECFSRENEFTEFVLEFPKV